LVFKRKILPFLFIAQPVITVHISTLVGAEIFRNQEQSRYKKNPNESDNNKKRSPNMAFHAQRPLEEFCVDALFKAIFSGIVKLSTDFSSLVVPVELHPDFPPRLPGRRMHPFM